MAGAVARTAEGARATSSAARRNASPSTMRRRTSSCSCARCTTCSLADLTTALAEARRVMRPDGAVYVAEPLAEGDFFALTSFVEDEVEVRAAAQAALAGAARAGLERARTVEYDVPLLLDGSRPSARGSSTPIAAGEPGSTSGRPRSLPRSRGWARGASGRRAPLRGADAGRRAAPDGRLTG